MDNLITILNEYHVESLRKMAEHVGLEQASSSRKKDIVKALNDTILQNAANPEYFQSLTRVEQASLAQLVTWNCLAPSSQLELRLVLTGLIRSPLDTRRSPLPTGDDVLQSLLNKGLLVDQTAQAQNKRRKALEHHDTIAIAADVQPYLMGQVNILPHGISRRPSVTVEPTHKRATSVQALFRQLLFVWSDLRRQPAKQLKSGTMSKRDLRRIALQLGLDRDKGIDTVTHLDELLRSMHLVITEDQFIKAVDSPAAALFWSGSTVHKVPDLLISYANLSYDLSVSLQEVRQYSYYSLEALQPMRIRQAMLNLIDELSIADGWISYLILSRFVLESVQHGSFALSSESIRALSYHTSWSAQRYETRLDQILHNLDKIIFINALNELADMGIIELGYDDIPDKTIPPIAIRLSSWVLSHYRKTPPPNDPRHGQVIVQPDFQILCMGPVSLDVLASVESCAMREKIDDSVISYRITKESVYSALQHGDSAASITEHLEEAAGQPVPQNIQRSLREWEGQHHRIVLHHNITIVQGDSVEIINELHNDAIAGPLINSIDEQTIWVHNDHLNTLEQRLTALQHLASFTDDAESDIENSMLWQDDCLHTRHPLPSLFVTANLRRFAEDVGTSRVWRITQASLAKAAQQGLTAPNILEHIATMTGNNIPPTWTQRIKAWMGYFGTAQSTSVRLLRLEQSSKINELREADPRLMEWLHPLPGARDVVSIEKQNWDAVCILLTEWGIPIKEQGWW